MIFWFLQVDKIYECTVIAAGIKGLLAFESCLEQIHINEDDIK